MRLRVSVANFSPFSFIVRVRPRKSAVKLFNFFPFSFELSASSFSCFQLSALIAFSLIVRVRPCISVVNRFLILIPSLRSQRLRGEFFYFEPSPFFASNLNPQTAEGSAFTLSVHVRLCLPRLPC